jgi:hypothetical protein
MYKPEHPVVIALLMLFVGACTNAGSAVSPSENMLAEAGFVSRSIDSPSRMALLKSLPPHRFVLRTTAGRRTYLYSDPIGCACVYVGDQQAYDRYRQQMATRQTATDDQVRAILSTAPLPGESGL